MAFALEADIPALLPRGAVGALGRELDVSRDISTLRERGVESPLELNS